MKNTNINLTTEDNHFYEGNDLNAMNNTNNYYAWIIDLIKDDVKGSILEVGAGSGNFSQVLINNFDNKLTSIEPSTEMFEILESKVNDNNQFKVQNCTLDKIQNAKFDTIIYNNVLEHIQDDQQELRIAYSMLNEGGKIILYSPAMPILMSNFDRSIGHYRRYTKKEKVAITEKAGFVITKKHYVDFPGFFAWFLAIKLMNIRIDETKASSYDKYIVPVLRKFDPSKYINFGKNILVIAVKTNS